jgi:3-dehydroquinate synthase
MRGINFIQIPTTLLASTDSSVGGKTAINTKNCKNLVGAFYQPKAVFININFLKTLDDNQYKSGLGEVVKYGFIEKSCKPYDNPHLINFLTEHYEKILLSAFPLKSTKEISDMARINLSAIGGIYGD